MREPPRPASRAPAALESWRAERSTELRALRRDCACAGGTSHAESSTNETQSLLLSTGSGDRVFQPGDLGRLFPPQPWIVARDPGLSHSSSQLIQGGGTMEPGASVRKPLRARKTMTPSSRKQVAMLNRMKGIGRPGRAPSSGLGGESPSADPRGVNRDAPKKEQNAPLPPPAPLVKPGTGLAAAALEISVCGGPREAAPELPKSPPRTDTDQFLSAQALQDLLYQLYENEPSFSPPKPVEVRLNVVPASCCAERAGEPRFPPASAANHSQERNGREPPLDGPVRVGAERENGVSPPHQDAPGSPVPLVVVGLLEGSLGSAHLGFTLRMLLPVAVKAFVRGHLDVAVGALDRALQDVSWRLERTQCLRRHEGVAIKALKGTSRLEKRVNAVVAAQAQLSKQMKLLGFGAPSKILNGCRPPPGPANHQPVPSTKPTSGGNQASPAVAEGLAASRASPRAAGRALQLPLVLIRRCSAEQHSWRDTRFSPDSGPQEDAEEGGGLGRPGCPQGGSARQAGGQPSPLTAAPAALFQAPWERVHLPPLPKVRLLPEEVRDFRGTAPPQKLQLTVVRLLKPKGLALQLDVGQADGRCALLDSFHLFFFLDSARAPFSWTRMKVVKALPLPVFIALGELPAAGTYYFAMQAKDVHGRYGPFSDIQAASVT
ncbi:hypothetical protein lerEdw1_004600 [Lerista edwardsae]|nr:hypothetical protein lerEdw1_004600 [Lerista edwardsae]